MTSKKSIKPADEQNIVGVSRILAAGGKSMSLAEWKGLICALTHVKFTENIEHNYSVQIDKREMAAALGISPDENHLSGELKKSLGKLAEHSFIDLTNADGWDSGCLIGHVGLRGYTDYITIDFSPFYMQLISGLGKNMPYIQLWAEDIYNMTSERSAVLYENLRLNSDDRQRTCSKIYTIGELRMLWHLPEAGIGSYMRPEGKFNREAFEKRVLDPVMNDLRKCKMIKIKEDNGIGYRKIKNAGTVLGYEIRWTVDVNKKIPEKNVKIEDGDSDFMSKAKEFITEKLTKAQFDSLAKLSDYNVEKLREVYLYTKEHGATDMVAYMTTLLKNGITDSISINGNKKGDFYNFKTGNTDYDLAIKRKTLN